MPLFVCDVCHAIENTACGHYWSRGMDFGSGPTDSRALCSECMPYSEVMKVGGKWHGEFEKTIATTEIIREMGESNFVYVGNIPGVKAKNACCDYHGAKKSTNQTQSQKKLLLTLTCKCGKSFKARKTSICKVCGETVEYEAS